MSCREKKGIVVPRQTEGALSVTLSDNRKQAEPITEEHNRQTEERDKKKRNTKKKKTGA